MRAFGLLSRTLAAFLVVFALVYANAAKAADPIRIGLSVSLTGGVAPIGKQVLTALQIWRDDVNAKGGLLGRPIELVFYDDQSNPSNVPQLYTKLIQVDKVDLLIGPYATNMVAPAIPVLAQFHKTTIGILANAANSKFHYDQYFSMLPTGPEPQKAFASGFFQLAAAQTPRPKTVAIVAADAEFAQNAADGARQSIKEMGGFDTVLDLKYPPTTTDYTPVMRQVQALNPDIVYVAAYPPDTVGLIRAANEIGVTPKMFGGAFIGLLVTPIKVQLGPLLNGIINQRSIPAGKVADVPGHQRVPGQVSGSGEISGHRSDGLGPCADRLFGRPGSGASGGRREDHRPDRGCSLVAQPPRPDRRWRCHFRQRRRMGEIAGVLHPVPASRRQHARQFPGYHP